jgi:hypothetical protein
MCTNMAGPGKFTQLICWFSHLDTVLNPRQCCGSGSRIRCLFESLMTIFCVKSSIIICKLTQIFFFTSSKIKYFTILQFCDICDYKKGRTTNFFYPFLLLPFLDPGSDMDINQDPGSVLRNKQTSRIRNIVLRYLCSDEPLINL